MDYVSLTKTNRLFWLGRYNERVLSVTQYMADWYDRMIDGGPLDYEDYCRRIGIPCPWTDSASFIEGYLFDRENPYSLWRAAQEMLGNGMVLRETISSHTLAYLQMAVNALKMAQKDSAPVVELQWVVDDVMAFRGSCEDFMEEENIRNILKCGISVERLSFFLRLEIGQEALPKEISKLRNRLTRSGLPANAMSLGKLDLFWEDEKSVSREELLQAVESLVVV